MDNRLTFSTFGTGSVITLSVLSLSHKAQARSGNRKLFPLLEMFQQLRPQLIGQDLERCQTSKLSDRGEGP